MGIPILQGLQRIEPDFGNFAWDKMGFHCLVCKVDCKMQSSNLQHQYAASICSVNIALLIYSINMQRQYAASICSVNMQRQYSPSDVQHQQKASLSDNRTIRLRDMILCRIKSDFDIFAWNKIRCFLNKQHLLFVW